MKEVEIVELINLLGTLEKFNHVPFVREAPHRDQSADLGAL